MTAELTSKKEKKKEIDNHRGCPPPPPTWRRHCLDALNEIIHLHIAYNLYSFLSMYIMAHLDIKGEVFLNNNVDWVSGKQF